MSPENHLICVLLITRRDPSSEDNQYRVALTNVGMSNRIPDINSCNLSSYYDSLMEVFGTSSPINDWNEALEAMRRMCIGIDIEHRTIDYRHICFPDSESQTDTAEPAAFSEFHDMCAELGCSGVVDSFGKAAALHGAGPRG